MQCIDFVKHAFDGSRSCRREKIMPAVMRYRGPAFDVTVERNSPPLSAAGKRAENSIIEYKETTMKFLSYL